MNTDNQLLQQIENVSSRLTQMHECVQDLPAHKVEVITEVLEQVNVSLEELRVAREELSHQNEQLSVTREQLERERQRYKELFEFAPDAYLVTDENGTIREANYTAAALLNVSQRFLVGKPLSIFVPEEERRDFRLRINQLRIGELERLREWELRMQPRKGESFEAAITVSAVWNPEGFNLRWMLRDITRRKKVEAQLGQMHLENLRLQEITQIKSQFLSAISHELRTPMNAILGFSQLLLRHPHLSLEPKQVQMVERIHDNGHNLLGLINDILDLSKVDAGRMELPLEEVDLVDLVHKTTDELQSLVIEKHLFLQVHTDLQNPITINNRSRLRQILVNLLANAIKFTETGGVRIEVSEVEGDLDRLVIEVKDTGIGIPKEDIERIFEAFEQVDRSAKRNYQSTGLGLAISKSLVDLMQGTITVTSQVGEGSTFRVELPRRLRVHK
ncbi:MAG: PAS domain S-box protein [Microcoleus vaginatus WJT46-NPBG5]|nr:PAS domain S-box protein [Microcoleus vaginatus WJT46-NPBG5]